MFLDILIYVRSDNIIANLAVLVIGSMMFPSVETFIKYKQISSINLGNY